MAGYLTSHVVPSDCCVHKEPALSTTLLGQAVPAGMQLLLTLCWAAGTAPNCEAPSRAQTLLSHQQLLPPWKGASAEAGGLLLPAPVAAADAVLLH